MLACWVEDPNGDAFKKHLARIPDYLWISEDGMTMQVIILTHHILVHTKHYHIIISMLGNEIYSLNKCFVNSMQSFGSQEWDAGFAVQALLATNLVEEIEPTLAKGHDFIKKSQVYMLNFDDKHVK